METAIAEYSATEAALSELRAKYSATIWVVDTPPQLTAAKKARAEIRTWRTSLEEERKRIKEPALSRCRAIDSEAKRITAELLKLEEPVDHAIKEVERAKAAAEQARIDKAHSEIASIRNHLWKAEGKCSSEIDVILSELEKSDVSRLDEFDSAAKTAKEETIQSLRVLVAKVRQQEAERALFAAEQAELAKKKAEQLAREKELEAREKVVRDQIAAEEQASRQRIAKAEEDARAVRRAEEEKARIARQAQDAELRAAQEKIAAEKREIEKARWEAERIRRQKEQDAACLADATTMLLIFKDRYHGIPQFAGVLKAIEEFFAGEKP